MKFWAMSEWSWPGRTDPVCATASGESRSRRTWAIGDGRLRDARGYRDVLDA
jgi:hypothetical protein